MYILSTDVGVLLKRRKRRRSNRQSSNCHIKIKPLDICSWPTAFDTPQTYQRGIEVSAHFPIPPNLKWDRRPSTEAEAEEFARIAKARVLRLHARGAATAVRVMCKRAYERAHDESANYGGLWERYRAALQIEALSAEQIEAIVFIGRHRHADGLVVWEVPVHNIAEETDENETAAWRL